MSTFKAIGLTAALCVVPLLHGCLMDGGSMSMSASPTGGASGYQGSSVAMSHREATDTVSFFLQSKVHEDFGSTFRLHYANESACEFYYMYHAERGPVQYTKTIYYPQIKDVVVEQNASFFTAVGESPYFIQLVGDAGNIYKFDCGSRQQAESVARAFLSLSKGPSVDSQGDGSYCSACGKRVGRDAGYCPSCGKKVGS